MRTKITSDGQLLEGTAKQIVEARHYVAFGQEQRTLSEYIDWAVVLACQKERGPSRSGTEIGVRVIG